MDIVFGAAKPVAIFYSMDFVYGAPQPVASAWEASLATVDNVSRRGLGRSCASGSLKFEVQPWVSVWQRENLRIPFRPPLSLTILVWTALV